jgi:hypothetical protein
MRTQADIAWATGLFEGEGTCTVQWNSRMNAAGQRVVYKKGRIHLALQMTDWEPVVRFASIIGLGRVFGPYQLASGRASWAWHTTRPEEATRAIQLLWPRLSPERKAKIRKVVLRGRHVVAGL